MVIGQKPMYLAQAHAIGIPATPSMVGLVGWLEIVLGAFVALRPAVPLIWFIFFWKLATESIYPFAGKSVDIFETIERWGDFGACIALLIILYSIRDRAPADR